jgi:glycosyltransferase involved in cell wall biosynthesis
VVNVSEGVDEQFQSVGTRHMPGYEYLLYVGNHKPHKNLPRLLDAFSLSGVQNRVKLIISGYAEPELNQIIRSLNLEQSVIFAGVIPDDALPAFYRGALALIFPSLYEGFGLPALEAMACGTPVITSNTTSLPEVVGDAAILVDPLSINEIAESIERICRDKALRETLRERGLRRATMFSWDDVTIRIKTVLDKLENWKKI